MHRGGHPVQRGKPVELTVEITLPPLPVVVATQVIEFANYLMAQREAEAEPEMPTVTMTQSHSE